MLKRCKIYLAVLRWQRIRTTIERATTSLASTEANIKMAKGKDSKAKQTSKAKQSNFEARASTGINDHDFS